MLATGTGRRQTHRISTVPDREPADASSAGGRLKRGPNTMAHYKSIGHLLFAGNGTVIVGALVCCGLAHAQNISLTPAAVEVQIHDVNLRLDRSTVLEIKTLRGQLVPIRRGVPVTFDDVNSFTTRINTAEIGISLRTLSDLLNQHVFAYPGAPLKNIALTADRGRMKQVGTIHKGIDITFDIDGTLN